MYSAISDHHQNYRSWVIAVEYELRSGHSITFGLGVMSAPTAAARLANFCWWNYRHEFGFKVGTPKTGRLIPKTAKLSRKFWAIFATWHFEIHDSLSLLIQLISKLSSPRSGRCGRCCCCRTAGCSTTGATGTGCCAGPGGCQADGEGGTAGGWAGGGVGHAWSKLGRHPMVMVLNAVESGFIQICCGGRIPIWVASYSWGWWSPPFSAISLFPKPHGSSFSHSTCIKRFPYIGAHLLLERSWFVPWETPSNIPLDSIFLW